MKSVGIIANPASGKDIRRLVAYGSVFNNNEKINIIKRILMALDAFGVQEVHLMPDTSALARRAMDDLNIALQMNILEMEVSGMQTDSTRAASLMSKMGLACIITLGGDGTNRVVSKGCGRTPLLPISTGTNNVFPDMIEGTMAGVAAGILASNGLGPEEGCRQMSRLDIYKGANLLDIALIDIVVTNEDYIGARAVWEVDSIKEVFLTRARPDAIGFSALGGYLNPLPPDSPQGLHISVGPGGNWIKAPIGPGLICELPIASHRVLEPGETVTIADTRAVIALDGEREISTSEEDNLTVRLNPDGPLVVDYNAILSKAAAEGLFLSEGSAWI